jgi:hypothetical protein
MTDFTENLARAKAKLPLDVLMRQLGYGEEFLKSSCKSPFRQEKDASWGVFRTAKGELKYKDFTTDERGDQVDFLASHLGSSTREALDTFLAMADVEPVKGNSHRPLPKRPVTTPEPPPEPEQAKLPPFDWQACVDALKPARITEFAKWRGYSPEFATWLQSQALIGLYRDLYATPVFQDGIPVGCQYRTLDKKTFYANATTGTDHEEKTPANALIIGKPDAQTLMVMESQWDAFTLLECNSSHQRQDGYDGLCFAITRSASNHAKVAGILKERAKSQAPGDVILVGQNDPPRLDGKPTGHDTLEVGLRKLCADIGLTLKTAMPPKRLKDVNDWWREKPNWEDILGIVDAAKASTKSKLTVRTVNELLGFKFTDDDNYFGDRILAEGQPATILGPGSIGKSRLLTQLAICSILGIPFLGIATHAAWKPWLIIQTENSNRRLQMDLRGLFKGLKLNETEINSLSDYLLFHTIEQENDSFADLENKEDFAAVQSLITDFNPTFVVFDPLNTFTAGDLNGDVDMRAACTAITRAVKRGNPKRVPIVVHHSRTGKAGAQSAVGWDKGSFGRNSKALYAWTRSQMNIAPRDPEDNTKLLVVCGKNNNGAYFPDIGVKYDEESKIYVVDEEFDPQQFREEVGLEKKPKADKGRPTKRALPIDVANLVTKPQTIGYTVREAVMKEFDVSRSAAYRMIDECENYGFITSEVLGKSKHYTRTVK